MSNDNFSRVITLFLANVTIANIATRLSISETAVEEVLREVLIDELLSPDFKQHLTIYRCPCTMCILSEKQETNE